MCHYMSVTYHCQHDAFKKKKKKKKNIIPVPLFLLLNFDVEKSKAIQIARFV